MKTAIDRSNGSALIAVYWVIALLSLTVFTTISLLFGELENRASQGQVFRARQLAEMGLAIASNPEVEPGDELLIAQLSELESYEATILSESAFLNLNAVLARGDLEVLQNLFVLWGLNPEEGLSVAEALVDWVDTDDLPTGLGAERDYYLSSGRPDLPPNRTFLSLEEVSQVRGMELVTRNQPDWQKAFTLWGDGKLNLLDASADLISAVCECSLTVAEAFVIERRGYDERENTLDDLEYESMDEILGRLGSFDGSNEQILSRVSIGGETSRLRSIGRMSEMGVEIEAVVSERGPEMLLLEMRQRSYRIPKDP